MSSDSRVCLEFLEQVEDALVEALDGGILPPDHAQRDEFEAMRREVAAVRASLAARLMEPQRRMAGAL